MTNTTSNSISSGITDMDCLEEMKKLHVLAVDDSFVDRKVIERLLTISSCKVTVVDSGKRALQLLGIDQEKSTNGFKGLKVHLVITDYSMPGMTGYELLKRIKESSSFCEVPVVIMSSENILTRINMCLEEGAKEYIVKPVKLADVTRLKEFILNDHPNVKKENKTSTSSLKKLCYMPSSPTFLPSTSMSRNLEPLIVGYPCSSPKCSCISRRPRFRNRSMKHQSERLLY